MGHKNVHFTQSITLAIYKWISYIREVYNSRPRTRWPRAAGWISLDLFKTLYSNPCKETVENVFHKYSNVCYDNFLKVFSSEYVCLPPANVFRSEWNDVWIHTKPNRTVCAGYENERFDRVVSNPFFSDCGDRRKSIVTCARPLMSVYIMCTLDRVIPYKRFRVRYPSVNKSDA